MHVSVFLLLLSLSFVFTEDAIEQDDEEDADVVEDGDLDGEDEDRPLMSNIDCTAPPETGFCRAAFTNWYYDPESMTCKTFTYGGCGGNTNNFETEAGCMRACANRQPKNPFTKIYTPYSEDPEPEDDPALNEIDAGAREDESICSLPAETGLCRARFTNWYYDSSTGTCQTFIYGGCGGNDNNFQTERECLSACGSPMAGGQTGQGNAGTPGETACPPTACPSWCALIEEEDTCPQCYCRGDGQGEDDGNDVYYDTDLGLKIKGSNLHTVNIVAPHPAGVEEPDLDIDVGEGSHVHNVNVITERSQTVVGELGEDSNREYDTDINVKVRRSNIHTLNVHLKPEQQRAAA